MSRRNIYRKTPQENVACCPCIKVKMGDIDGLEKEAQDRVSYSQTNIDSARSGMNLFVHGLDMNGNPVIDGKKFDVRLRDRILGRIKETGATIRYDKKLTDSTPFARKGKNTKESVVAIAMELQVSHSLMMSLLKDDGMLGADGRISIGKQLPTEGKTYKLFAKAFKWVCAKYGKENVVGSYIHLDEYTPHMHVFIVPIRFKPSIYRKAERRDNDGVVIMRVRLDAKGLFSKDALKNLWSEFAAEMEEFGATAAKGLQPKGAYDRVATMDAVIEQKLLRLNELTSRIGTATEEFEKAKGQIVEKKKECFREEARLAILLKCIRPLEKVYYTFVKRLQTVVDNTRQNEPITVLGFEIREETKTCYSQTGQATEYVDMEYIIHCAVRGEKQRLSVKKNDYYNATDNPLKKAISRFFFDNLDLARSSNEIHAAIMSAERKLGLSR
jgi:hypothetical protein